MAWSAWVDPVFAGVLRLVCLFALIVAAAYTDMVKGTVSNWLTLPGLALGLVLSFFAGDAAQADLRLLLSGIGAALGFGILFIFYWSNQVGAGDVKLMGAVGAYLGYPLVVYGMVYIALVGALLALGMSIKEGRLLASLKGVGRAFFLRGPRAPAVAAAAAGAPSGAAAGPATAPATIPFGVAIAAGTLWTCIANLSGLNGPAGN